jgi:hypothetical protein
MLLFSHFLLVLPADLCYNDHIGWAALGAPVSVSAGMQKYLRGGFDACFPVRKPSAKSGKGE